MEQSTDYELVVSQGNLPWWRILVAAVFFTYMIYTLYLFGVYCYYEEFNKMPLKLIPHTLEVVCYCLSGGIAFSVTKTVLIDVDQDKLISRYAVGPFSRDILTSVPQLDYISVFLNSKDEYEVNLWYIGNKHYNMYSFTEKEPAFLFGQQVSNKLNIDLLDATERGNNKWVDKDKL